ncbi:hypothetical protein BGZ59_002469, partial [Podila verticillata]
MVHYKIEEFFERHPDLSVICHFDFFDSAPCLSEADACNVWLSCLTTLVKDSDPTTKTSLMLLKERYFTDKKNGKMKQYWDRRKLKQELEKSKEEATIQAVITVNRTTSRVMQSAEKQVDGHLKKIDDSIYADDESSSLAAALSSSAPSSSSLPTSSTPLSSPKKRKRPTIDREGWTSTSTETIRETDFRSRKERFAVMDQDQFWKLRSGRTVEEILFTASLKLEANFKMRSYTIDFGCERTKALFTKDEWREINELNDFQLPKLPESTEKYLRNIRKALVQGQHVASVPVPEEDRYSCELVLRSFLSWSQLYKTKPCPFGNKDLSESFWCREAWPIMKGLLTDVDGLTMIDGEKAGLESGKRKNMGRKVDVELSTPRKQTGRKLDLVARDTTNKRDWFIVESNKEWDEVSTKHLREIDMTLFKDLHLIASHRLQEQSSAQFRSEARFLSVYSGGRGFRTMEMRACPSSPYVMLVHLYDAHLLPSMATTWKLQAQGLAHLLQVKVSCVTTTIKMYEAFSIEKMEEEESDGEWLYSSSSNRVFDETL